MIKIKNVVLIGVISLGLVGCGSKDYTDYYNSQNEQVISYSDTPFTDSYEREVSNMFDASIDYMNGLGVTMDKSNLKLMEDITNSYIRELNSFNINAVSDSDLLLNIIALDHYTNMLSGASSIQLYLDTKDFMYIEIALEYIQKATNNIEEASNLINEL